MIGLRERACRRADDFQRQLASGVELQVAERAQLREHLGACSDCRKRAEVLPQLFDLWRGQDHQPKVERILRMRAGIDERLAEPSGVARRSIGQHQVLRSPGSRGFLRRPLLAGGAVAAMAVASVFIAVSVRQPGEGPSPVGRHAGAEAQEFADRSASRAEPRAGQAHETREAHEAHGAREAHKAHGATPAVAPDRVARGSAWRVMQAMGARVDGVPVRRGAKLERSARVGVGATGAAVLAGRATVVRLAPKTRVELPRTADAPLRLLSGRVELITRGSGEPTTVSAGRWRIAPVGTAYAVDYPWRKRSLVRVSVAEGAVHLIDGDRTIAVVAGSSVQGDGTRQRMPRRDRQRLLVQLRRARSLVGDVLRTPARRSQAPVLHPRHDVRPRSTAVRRGSAAEGPRRSSAGESKSPAESPALMLGGSRATTPLPAVPPDVVTPQPKASSVPTTPRGLTENAESHMREGRMRKAAVVYREVHRRYRQTEYGAQALYMVGSIQVEHLRQARAADKTLERYLTLYPRGSQRQDAYLLRYRARQRLGDADGAERIADAYQQEYPKGRYLRFLKSTRSDEAQK